jgi:hypothetical protein
MSSPSAETPLASDPGGVLESAGRCLEISVKAYPDGFTQGTAVMKGKVRASGTRGLVVLCEVRWQGCATDEDHFLWCVRDLITRTLKQK